MANKLPQAPENPNKGLFVLGDGDEVDVVSVYQMAAFAVIGQWWWLNFPAKC